MKTRLVPLTFAAALLLGGCNLISLVPLNNPVSAPAVATPAKAPACAGKPLRKVLVATFPLRYPEQLRPGEYMGWAQTTAEELARRLDRDGYLRAIAALQHSPFANIEGNPELARDAAGKPRLTEWAARAQAQYVIAGVFGDFGNARKMLVVPERQLAVEAYLYDGITGAQLARKEFSRHPLLVGTLPRSIAPGTQTFDGTLLGSAYNSLIAEMGAWVADTLTCLPLPARVTQIEGRRLTIDVGADSGLQAGMGLSALPPAAGRSPRIDALVREVQAGHAVADLGFHRDPQSIKPDDILYVADSPLRNKP